MRENEMLANDPVGLEANLKVSEMGRAVGDGGLARKVMENQGTNHDRNIILVQCLCKLSGPVQTGSGNITGNMGLPRPKTKQSHVLGKSQTGTGTTREWHGLPIHVEIPTGNLCHSLGTTGFGPVQTGSVMVCPLTLHGLLKPCLHLQQLNSFLNLLDWPLTHLGHQPTSHSLSQTLV